MHVQRLFNAPRTTLAGTLALVLLAAPAMARADDGPSGAAAPAGVAAGAQEVDRAQRVTQPTRVRLRLELGLWNMGPGGELRLPGSPATGRTDEVRASQLDQDVPRFTPTGKATLEFGDAWFASLQAAGFSDTQTAEFGSTVRLGTLTFNAGDLARSRLEYATVELKVGLMPQSWRYASEHTDDHGVPSVAVRAMPFVGAQVIDADWNVTVARGSPGPDGFSTSAGNTYVHPIVGVGVQADFGQRFRVELTLQGGGLPLGDNTSYGADVIVMGTYRVTPNIGLQLGYRSAFFGLSEGTGVEEFSYNGAQQGLLFGVMFEF